MGWTCGVAGLEPGTARASFCIMARATAPYMAPTMAVALLLALFTSANAATSYHRFASGLGMNIRHLPCVSRRSGEAGTCMFAYSCAKLNGTHLGTCIDRFYFGSCCRMPPGVELDAVPNHHLDQDTNFIDDNNIATSEKPRPPTQTIKPQYPVTTSTLNTITRIPPTVSVTPSTKRPTPSTSSQRPPSTSQRPRPTTQRPQTPSVSHPSTPQPSTVQTTPGTLPTKKYTPTSFKPPSPTTPAPTLVTWTTIDGFPPRKPPSIVAPAASTTHRTPTSRPPVTVDHSKPTSVFNTTISVVTSPKPSSPAPASSRPSVTVISTSRPSQKPISTKRPTIPSTKPSTNRPPPITTVITPKPTVSKPSPSTSRPVTKPPSKPTKTPVKPPIKVTVKPSSPKPVTSVTILSSSRPTRPTRPAIPPTKPTRPPTQRPTIPTRPSTVAKPSTSKPTPKPTVKPTSNLPSKPPTKPTRPTTTKPVKFTNKPSTKPTKPPTSRPTVITTTTTEASTDPDWVQVSVSSHEPSLPTTLYLTSENPWMTGRPGSTESSTIPVTFTTDTPVYTSPSTIRPFDENIITTLPIVTGSSTVPPPLESNEVLNINMSDFRDVCGRRLFPEPRIVGGNKSTFGKWPWQISLRQWRTSTYLHKCGAALLSENWAITAAHCVENVPPSDLLLRLGEYDLSTEEEPYTFQERRVQIVASHPQFDPRTFEYDLALLRFYDPVQFQPNIIPICVPADDTNFVGRTAYVTGWGRLYEDGPLPSVLQEVSVPVINNTVCETMYRAAGYIEHIPDIFICAGWKKGGYDSCEGDSGGPMVIERDDDKRWMLAGVISWGIGCAEPNQPGVYTRISHFRHWINQILQF